MFARLAGATLLVLALATAAGAASAQPCGDEVVVRPGETIGRIARRCGVDPRAIFEANPGIERYRVRPGDRLRMPFVHGPVDITVSPREGRPGSRVTVVVSGLRPHEPVQLGVSQGPYGFHGLANARADASGRVITELVVPEAPDGRTRFAAATPNGQVLARSRGFYVVYDRGWRGPQLGRVW